MRCPCLQDGAPLPQLPMLAPPTGQGEPPGPEMLGVEWRGHENPARAPRRPTPGGHSSSAGAWAGWRLCPLPPRQVPQRSATRPQASGVPGTAVGPHPKGSGCAVRMDPSWRETGSQHLRAPTAHPGSGAGAEQGHTTLSAVSMTTATSSSGSGLRCPDGESEARRGGTWPSRSGQEPRPNPLGQAPRAATSGRFPSRWTVPPVGDTPGSAGRQSQGLW